MTDMAGGPGASSAGRKKVVMIALDAGDQDVILEGIERGEMPNLAKLQANGAYGQVGGLRGFGSGSNWASFCTGATPGKHSRYFYRQVGPGSYKARTFDGADYQCDVFWQTASDAGKRVAVIDAPTAPMTEDINGISIADWLTHDLVYQELRTYPAELVEEITDDFGQNPLWKCDRPGGRTEEEFVDLIATLRARIATRTEGNRRFYQRDDWDLFFTTYSETHCVGHQCWHLHDTTHQLRADGGVPEIDDPVRSVYRAIDDSIGDLLEHIDDDTTVVVFTATGMGPNYTGNMVVDELLRRIEGVEAMAKVKLTARLKRFAKRVLPNEIKRRYRPLKRQVEEAVQEGDRARRKVFAVPHNDLSGAVRLNIIGREASGILQPGDEVERFIEELTRDLLDLRNLDTDEPLIREVIRVSDEVHGPHVDDMPDLLLLWNRSGYPDRVGSDKVGEVSLRHRGNRTGDHRPDHFFFAAGPTVEPGRVDDRSILDFAPTLMQIIGVDLPDTDGSVIPELTRDPAASTS